MALPNSRSNGQNKQNKVVMQGYQGPLPPSQELDRYNKIDNTFANRIVTMAENQAKHRQEMEQINANNQTKIIKREARDSLLGLIFGLIIVSVALYLAFLMIEAHQYTGGIFTIFTVIGTIVAAFIIGNKSKK
ncbi:DUF2335 domain-containing protein [Leuconostoc lactis]|uniref:DUF2335 domain-containing protein n=1 Tax=Leuconostoc lactis TaxID=1246 RepID=UPI001896F126|nr:DUF2335 domain-containing protein [Leuconostoc lactis]MDI6572750.1 DUF2335 domain-containing protein [Leuconostoc lactis]